MAKTEAAAVNLNIVSVPINLLTTVIAVAVTPSVSVKVAGAAGIVAVTVYNLAVLSALGATLTDEEDPTPFTAFTPNTKEVVPASTSSKLT